MRNIILISCAFIFITCSSSTKDNNTDTTPKLNALEHSITYSNKGTRSEAQDGHLYFQGKEIPYVFTYVRDGKTEYKFFTRKFLWGNGGYFPVLKQDNRPTVSIKSEKAVSTEFLEKGWYMGSEMLSGTPTSWIYLEWEQGKAYAAPEAIENMIQSLGLKPVPRLHLPKTDFKKE